MRDEDETPEEETEGTTPEPEQSTEPEDAEPEAPAEPQADTAPDAAAEEPQADAAPEEPAQPAADEETPEAPERPPSRSEAPETSDEVIPGAHLEPDLVLETPSEPEGEYDRYAEPEDAEATEGDADAEPAAEPTARGPLDLAGDARYRGTGKRKTSVARVILKPGSGVYRLNGRPLEEFFPRAALRRRALEALEVVGYSSRMDVTARLHGGGVSSQAGALRHGIARALVEADPNLRRDLKRRGFLTRDAREKERRKAGLRKARKRPQFSKR